MPLYKNKMFNIMVTLGTPEQGTCFQVFQIIGLLKVPSRTCMEVGQEEHTKKEETNMCPNIDFWALILIFSQIRH